MIMSKDGSQARAVVSLGLFWVLSGSAFGQNQGWLPGFSSTGITHLAGTSSTPQTLDVIGANTIVAPGFFEGPAEDGTQTYALAIYNGEYWRFEAPYNGGAFLGSTGGFVLEAEPLISDICLGGTFNAPLDLPSSFMNCWNGGQFYELGGPGNGPNGQVDALAFDGEDIYAGGLFTAVGAIAANSIAHFDLSDNVWKPLGSGMTGGVTNMVTAAPGVSLYPTGPFTSAGGMPETWGIARWRTGANTWQQVGSGGISMAGDGIVDVTADGGSVYVAGGLTAIGDAIVDRIARFRFATNGWEPMGSPGSSTGPVDRIQATPGGDVFAVGPFGGATDVLARYIPDSQIWVETPGLDALKDISGTFSVIDMDAFGSDLYVLHTSGYDPSINTIYAPYFARFDGADWHGLGTGVGGYGFLTDRVNAIQDFGDDVIVGGSFDNAGSQIIPLVARWDGAQWHPLGEGLERPISTSGVEALDVFGDDLYLGGNYEYQGGRQFILRWDGASLSTLPGGPDIQRVDALEASGNFLFVGGQFNSVPTEPLRGVVTFNGTEWGSIGGGANGDVHAIRVVGADMYIGGDIFGVNENTQSVSNLAHWNGSTWDDLGGGVTRNAFVAAPAVSAIEVKGTDIYVAGSFTSAGGVPANNIARWDGARWHALGQGLNGVVEDILIVDNALFAVGRFDEAGGEPASRIAVWNGLSWQSVGWGLRCNCTLFNQGRGQVLYERPEALWIGGQFTSAGDKISNNLTRFDRDGIMEGNFETNSVFGNPVR